MKALKQAVDTFSAEMTANAGRLKNLGRYVAGQLKAPEVGTTPHRILLDVARTQLLEYTPPEPPKHAAPLLFVPSLVNRHYILDLIPERSVVRYVQKSGLKVYLVDWGVPGLGDSRTDLGDYVLDRLDLAVNAILEREGTAPSLAGYCMGGSLAMAYAARFPRKVRNLVLLATPIDFEQAGLLRLWADRSTFDLDRFVDANGLVPPDVLNQAFTMLKPSWQARNLYSLIRFGWSDDFLRSFMSISKWVNDPVPVAGEAFRQYVQDFYRDNRVMGNSLSLRGEPVDFGNVACPVLNVIAQADHIVPPECSRPAERVFTGSPDFRTLELPVGHIGLSVGQGAFSKVWKQIIHWLETRSA
jgi:polyhydroxyalkanoate synthase